VSIDTAIEPAPAPAQADHAAPAGRQLAAELSTDETGGSADQVSHVKPSRVDTIGLDTTMGLQRDLIAVVKK
jgi:hypothetical protein